MLAYDHDQIAFHISVFISSHLGERLVGGGVGGPKSPAASKSGAPAGGLGTRNPPEAEAFFGKQNPMHFRVKMFTLHELSRLKTSKHYFAGGTCTGWAKNRTVLEACYSRIC